MSKKARNKAKGLRIRIACASAPAAVKHVPAARRRERLSADFLSLLLRSLAGAAFMVFILAVLLRWRNAQELAMLEHLALVRAEAVRQHADLLAQRDLLLSKPRIVAAAQKLGLHLPEKGQEHNLY